jgi:hypothetical protein
MAILRAVVDEEQEAGRREVLHQPVEHGLRLGVYPVEVLEHDQERLDLAFPQEEPSQGINGSLPPRRVERLPPAILHRHVEEREERRQRRLERAVEREELAGGLLPDGAGCVAVANLEVPRRRLATGRYGVALPYETEPVSRISQPCSGENE